MCGIVAYIGQKAAQPVMIEGLKRLEYRGYDSAGIALLRNGKIEIQKTKGRISDLEKILNETDCHGAHRNRPYPMGNARGAEYR